MDQPDAKAILDRINGIAAGVGDDQLDVTVEILDTVKNQHRAEIAGLVALRQRYNYNPWCIGIWYIIGTIFSVTAILTIAGLNYGRVRQVDACFAMTSNATACSVGFIYTDESVRVGVVLFGALITFFAGIITTLTGSRQFLEDVIPSHGTNIELVIVCLCWVTALAVNSAILLIPFTELHTSNFYVASLAVGIGAPSLTAVISGFIRQYRSS